MIYVISLHVLQMLRFFFRTWLTLTAFQKALRPYTFNQPVELREQGLVSSCCRYSSIVPWLQNIAVKDAEKTFCSEEEHHV